MAVQPEAPTESDFDVAFSELTMPDDAVVVAKKDEETSPAQTAAVETPVEGGLPDPATVTADGTTPLTAEEAATAAKAVADAAAATPAAAAVEASAADKAAADKIMLDRFRDMVKEAVPAAPAAKAEAPPPAPAVTPFTAEEQKIVDDFRTEWPDAHTALQLERQREYQALTNYIFGEVLKVIQPMMATTETLATQTYDQQLHAAIPDIGEITPGVRAWIAEQPGYLKSAYEQVASTGNVADVKNMVDRFRVEKNVPAPAPVAPAAPSPEAVAAAAATLKAPAPVLDAKAAAAVKALAPVETKRSSANPAGTVDQGDFDGAFSAFAGATL